MNKPIYYLLFSLLFVFSCSIAIDYSSKSKSLLKQATSHEYTLEEINQHKDDPKKYNQLIFNYFFSKLNAKNSRLAFEIAKLRILNDGITSGETEGLKTFCEVVNGLSFPEDFAKVGNTIYSNKIGAKRAEPHEILIKWSGGSSWNGKFWSSENKGATVFEVTPYKFDEGDKIKTLLKGYSLVSWNSKILSEVDSDGIIIKTNHENLKFGKGEYSILFYNPEYNLSFNISDLFEQDVVRFGREQGIEGLVEISLINKNRIIGYGASVNILEDLMLPGVGLKGYSIPLQELIKGFASKEYTENNNPLLNKPYPGWFKYTVNKWGNMKGEGWKTVEEIKENLRHPELFDFYMTDFIHPGRWRPPQSCTKTIKIKTGDCKSYAIAAYDCIVPSGIKGYILTMDPSSQYKEGHSVFVFKKGSKLGVIDHRGSGGLKFGFDSDIDILVHYGFPKSTVKLRESSSKMMARF